MPSFQELLDKYAFLAYEKQFRLSSLIGNHKWMLDVEKAKVSFNNKLVFPVHFLGTESTITNTWLWADTNRKVGFPQHSIELCRKVRSLGGQLGVSEFLTDSFSLVEEIGKPTGHTIAMVATCLCGESCYYRGPHENGAVYVTLSDQRIDSKPDFDRSEFSRAFNELMWLPGDMKTRLVSYCSEKGYIGKDFKGDELTCQLNTGEKVSFTFKTTTDGGMSISFLPMGS